MDTEKNKRLELAVGFTWRIAIAHGAPGLSIKQLVERLVSKDVWYEQEVMDACKKLKLGIIEEEVYKKNYEKKIERRIKCLKKVWAFWEKLAWIKMVAITGSVAGGYPESTEDMDIMLVCADKRLWLCRLVSFIWLKINRVELRTDKMEKSNSLCLNLWLEESSLAIEESKRNLSVAQDAIMCKPLVDKGEIKLKVLARNSWIKSYLATGFDKLVGKWTDKKVRVGAKGDLLSILNLICYGIQRLYMSKKIDREVVRLDRAYFHPHG